MNITTFGLGYCEECGTSALWDAQTGEVMAGAEALAAGGISLPASAVPDRACLRSSHYWAVRSRREGEVRLIPSASRQAVRSWQQEVMRLMRK